MERDRDKGPQRVEPERREPKRIETEPVVSTRQEASEVRQSQTTKVLDRRDSARWGSIWAGLITALTTFLLLQLLAIGLGLVGVGPNNTGSGWVPAVIGLIAFFTGGSVAGMTSSVRGTATGLLNGFLVWALGTVLILALSALGLGQIFGALGNVVGQLNQLNLVQSLQGGANVPNVDPAQIAQAVRNAALAGFFGLLLSALAAMLGGWLGGRTDDPIGHTASD